MYREQATVENPTMYAQPWTLEIPWILPAEAKHQIFESACLTGILSGARALESDAAGSK